jgi:predicted acylesterase/phospholipase RssA
MEGRHDHLVYEIDRTDSYWGQLAVRQADRVMIVVSPEPDGVELAALDAVMARLESLPDVPVWFVMMESGSARIPSPSAELRRRHRPTELMHVRRNQPDEAARVARLVIDQGTGLVLSGGGAKGFAHIGAVRALNERKVPIDRIGGASIGAVVAGGFAMGFDPDELAESYPELFRGLMDHTIPLVSLLKGRRTSNAILDFFSGWSIEDTWLPFYCVSSDLTAGELHVHTEGSLAEAIRASIAIPGMLPPIARHGRLLVDGGVLDNLPVDAMRAQPGISRIVAIDVAPAEGPGESVDHGPHVTATQVLRSRFSRTPSPYPGLPSVLVRSMLVGAVRDRNRVMQSGATDVYIDVDVPDVELLDFDKGSRSTGRGYTAAIEAIDRWQAAPGADGG